MAITIVIADPYPSVRAGIRGWLEEDSEFQIKGEAKDGEEALRLIKRWQPDVLILDWALPVSNGISVLNKVQRNYPLTHVVVYSQTSLEECLIGVLGMGARGFVLKDSPGKHLIEAVRAAAADEYYLGPPFAANQLDEFLEAAREPMKDPLNALTPREREVLHLVAQGVFSAEIAEQLHISPRTVEMHRARMMRKLNLRNLADFTLFSLRRGLISLNGG